MGCGSAGSNVLPAAALSILFALGVFAGSEDGVRTERDFVNANPFPYPFSGSRHCAGLNFEEGPEGDREMRQSECVSLRRGKMEAMGGSD